MRVKLSDATSENPDFVPDMGFSQIIDTIVFRRALEAAIGRGVTLEAIATRLETSPESVGRWRKGEKLPHADYCDAITEVLNRM